MAKNYVMALDAGTTSNRASIFDRNSKNACSQERSDIIRAL